MSVVPCFLSTVFHLNCLAAMVSPKAWFKKRFSCLLTSSKTMQRLKIPYYSEYAELSSTGLMVMLSMSATIGTTFVDRLPRRALLFTFGGVGTTFLLLFVISASLTTYTWWMKYACLGSMFLYMLTYA